MLSRRIKKIKAFIVRIVDFFWRSAVPRLQALAVLNTLSPTELSGKAENLTKFKLIKHGVYELPFDLGRTMRGVRFNLLHSDPFLFALESQSPENFNAHILSRQFAEAYSYELSLKIQDRHPDLLDTPLGILPLWAMVYPWEKESPFFKLSNYMKKVMENRMSFLSMEPNQEFEVLDPTIFGRSQAVQFADLLNSISSNGFQYGRSMPCVYILRSGDIWRWIMSGSGNHRAYLLNYLRYPLLPARIVGLIDRDDIASLPLVRDGTYTIEFALHLFDSVFDGDLTLRSII